MMPPSSNLSRTERPCGVADAVGTVGTPSECRLHGRCSKTETQSTPVRSIRRKVGQHQLGCHSLVRDRWQLSIRAHTLSARRLVLLLIRADHTTSRACHRRAPKSSGVAALWRSVGSCGLSAVPLIPTRSRSRPRPASHLRRQRCRAGFSAGCALNSQGRQS